MILQAHILDKVILMKSFLTGVMHDRSKPIYTYLNEGIRFANVIAV